MPLLLEDDYSKLNDWGITYQESPDQRFLIFTGYQLPQGLYTVERCDVLVVIPPNYNQAGNDMFWTLPRLRRVDGQQIPNTNDPAGGDNRIWNGNEFCRWSRHWPDGQAGAWRPGKDNVITIYRRVDWALRNPNGQ